MKPWRRNKHHDADHDHTDHYDRNTERHDHDSGATAGTPGQHLGPEDRSTLGEKNAHDRFGGVNFGAAFFGWLVAIAMTVLLMSILGAIASAVGASTNFSQTDAEREASAVGLGAAIALVVVMAIAYYAGGYVAGRMSRFDGARQGFAVWALGLIVTLLAVGLGYLFGSQYNILDRVNLPTDAATMGGIITALALLIGTLLAAMAGGKMGHRYHNKVDRAATY
jgi:amino acid transporter